MSSIDAIFLSLGSAIVLALFARRSVIPYPSILVLGGLAIALIPGVPQLAIQPSIILSVFLPAILFAEANQVSWRDMRWETLRVVAIGLVLVLGTCAAVALVAIWLFPGIPIPVAIVLGAIVAPADSVASNAVLEQLHVPHRILAKLTREGLVNDTVAVIIYKLAVATVLGSVVSLPSALGGFTLSTIGGAVLGLGIGWVGSKLLGDSREHVAFSLLSLSLAFGAYIAADAVGMSGALATVATGLVCGFRAEAIPAELRFNANVVFEVTIFGLNAFGFLLIGAQLPTVVADLSFYTVHDLAFYAAAIIAAILAVRLLTTLAVAFLARAVQRARNRHDSSWRDHIIIGWSGMRGLVSLAAALGLPPTPEGSVFPYRDLALFLAFAVILFTLVVQGLSLAGFVRIFRVNEGDVEQQEHLARIAAAEAALNALEQRAINDAENAAVLTPLRQEYRARIARLHGAHDQSALAAAHDSLTELRRQMIATERRELFRLARSRSLDSNVLHELLGELDAAEIALGKR